MQRTQIYLTREQMESLRRISESLGVTQSEIIREAVDRYITGLGEEGRKEIRQRAAGLWSDREDLPAFFLQLRQEGDRAEQAWLP